MNLLLCYMRPEALTLDIFSTVVDVHKKSSGTDGHNRPRKHTIINRSKIQALHCKIDNVNKDVRTFANSPISVGAKMDLNGATKVQQNYQFTRSYSLSACDVLTVN